MIFLDDFKFYLITDTHYFKNSLGAYGKEYEEYMDTQQKCFAETEAIDIATFKYLEDVKDADTILIAGDLSFNGEKESHIALREHLLKLKESGKRIFVVTAGHDINAKPFCYNNADRSEVEHIEFNDLYGYYKEFGYEDAIAFNKEHMSYVAQLADGLRLLVICNDTAEGRNVPYSDEFFDWMKEQLVKAKEDGQKVIAMEHYPVIAGQPILELIGDARQRDAQRLINTLADNGVHLIFTGHMHNQSINVKYSDNGNVFYDVCTGSVIGCPAYMRRVTLKENYTKAEIESIPVPDFEWDTKGKSCETYLKDQFDRMLLWCVEAMEKNPQKFLSKIGADKPSLYKIIAKLGKGVNSWTVGKIAGFFFVKAPKEVKDIKFKDFAVDLARSVFEGDQPFTEDTPLGEVFLKVLKRLKPVLKILNKKLHGSQGEQVDLYEMLKHSAGNYGISDNNATLNLE